MTAERAAAQRRGCLITLALYLGAAVILVAVWATWPAGSGSPSPEPVPSPTTSSPSYTREPVTFPYEVNRVLEHAWNAGRHGCGITGPAVDDLAAALERDIGEAPPEPTRVTASRWVSERCRG